MKYVLMEAKCSCRTHIVAAFMPIGKCGSCGERPEIDWEKGKIEDYEID